MPALDGLRGAAVVAVLLYHGSFLDRNWMRGGYLGVDLFFVLSGYLITSLLLIEFHNGGAINLPAFWGRRVRRLLPALLLMLAGIAVYSVVIARPVDLGQIRADGLGTLFYVANWVAIRRGGSYWDISLAPSPLQHTWSLAIEEQFYLLWPLVVWALAKGCGAAHDRGALLARRVQLVAVGGTVVSAWLFIGLWRLGASDTRVYQGTDTRAFALLMGVALAATRQLRSAGGEAPAPRRIAGSGLTWLEASGLVSLVLLGWAWVSLSGTSPWLYKGLLPVCSLLAAVVIAAASAPGSVVVGRLLAVAPLRWFGLVSYGLYLWHWPIYLVLTPDRTGLSGISLLAVRIAASVAVAALSYLLLEQPIRTRQWRLPRPVPIAIGAVAITALLVVVSSVGATDPSGGIAGGPRRPRAKIEGAPRVDYVGDSVGYSLATPVVADPAAYGVNPINRAGLGCAFMGDGRRVRALDGNAPTTPKPCLRPMIASTIADDPDAVVLAFGAPPTKDVELGGSFHGPCDGEYRTALRSLYDELIDQLTAKGAVVLVGTVVPRTELAPAGELERVQCINDVVRKVAIEDTNAALLDLAAFVCPDGACREQVDGKPLRPDGIHFSGPGGDTVGAWVASKVTEAVSD